MKQFEPLLGPVADATEALFEEGFLIHRDDLPPALWFWEHFTLDGDPRIAQPDGWMFYHAPSMDALEKTREAYGEPLYINSGFRSALYNLSVRGASRSCHHRLAFDVNIGGDILDGGRGNRLVRCAREAGFGSIGVYETFVHMDLRPGRRWGTASWGDTHPI